MRFTASFMIAAAALSAACGPTVLVEGDVDGDWSSGGNGAASGGSGADSGGTGASSGGTGASSGSSGSGAGSSGSGSGSSGSASSGGPGKPGWAKAIGTEGHQHLRGLGVDHSGNVIAAGTFDGEINLGTGPLPQKGARSGFVVKLDTAGKPIWGTSLTGDDCAIEAIAINNLDEIYATGVVKGALAVGPLPVPGGDGIFVAKLDAQGKLVWARTFGSSASMEADRGLSVSTGYDGEPLVSGSYLGALDLGNGPLPGPSGVFVARLSNGGTTKWSAGLPGTTAFLARVPDPNQDDDAIVAINEDAGTLRTVRLAADGGAMLWSKTYGAGIFTAITADGTGGVLLAGSTKSADFGGGPLPSPLPNGEGFLVALDGDGHHRFTRGLPFDSFQSTAAAIGLDGAGNAAVTGSYVVHVDSSTVIQSAFLMRFDLQGNKLSSATFGPLDAGTTQEGWGLGPAPAGGLYLGGDFYAAIAVSGTTLTGSGNADVFVARLAF